MNNQLVDGGVNLFQQAAQQIVRQRPGQGDLANSHGQRLSLKMANRNRYHPILVALEQNEKILRSPQTLLRVGIGVNIENVHRDQAIFVFFHRPRTWVNGPMAPIISSTII